MLQIKDAFRPGLFLFVTFATAAAGCAGMPDSDEESDGSKDSAVSAAACAAAQSWAPWVAYGTGALVKYQGKVYQCIQGHTSQPDWTPAAVPALWGATSCASPGGGNGGAGGAGGGAQGGKLFVGYYQTWSDGWKANGADTALAHLPAYVNVVNLSFAKPDMSYSAGSLSLAGTGVDTPYDGPTLKAAVTALHQSHPGTKVMLSVGGATYTGWGGFNASAVASFVKDFGLDGADLDYEPANPACSSSGGVVSCPSDAEYVGIVNAMRGALPKPYWVSIAGFSVGAYGEGQWAAAPPASSYAGLSLAVLKQAGSALDLVNVMSYDAGPSYDPQQALQAYQHYFSGKITMGIEVPPEAWGGHVETIAEIDTLAAAVNASGAAGLMLWSIQKPGPAQQFATEMCTKLGLGGCSTPML